MAQCEAQVYDEGNYDESRLCRRPAPQGDRLCSCHRKKRSGVNAYEKRFVITINKKPSSIDERGNYKVTAIGMIFETLEDAQLWADLNSTLIFRIPRIVSYSLERYDYVLSKTRRYSKHGHHHAD